MKTYPTTLVTGAGSGIGRAVALRLAAAGYALSLASRTVGDLERTAELIAEQKNNPPPLLIRPTDITDPQQIHAMIDETVERFGRLDAVANVAGYVKMLPIEKTTPQLWQQTIDVNLTAPVLITAAAWAHLKHQRGIIVNVSSLASIDPFPGLSLYAAAKVALNMFTRCTAQQGQADGIRAVAIAPGAVETPMLRSLIDHESLPTNQTLSPDTVAQTVVGCITGKHPFEPGQTLLMPSPA